MMSTYKILSCLPNSNEFELFQKLPVSLYTGEQLKLKSTENINTTLLYTCIVVLKNDMPVARACLYNNHELIYNSKKSVCVGNYECINDDEAAELILNEITLQAKNLGAEFIIGPMNGSTWDSYRFSLHNSSPNFFLEPYHHSYYNNQFINNGYQVIERYESKIDNDLKLPDENKRKDYELRFNQKHITVRPIDLLNYEKDIENLYELSTQSFVNNVLYTPISKEVFLQKYLPIKQFMNPDFVLVAENSRQEMIGFIFCIHDFCCTTKKRLIVKTIARLANKEYEGLASHLINYVVKKSIEQNYKSMIHAFMHENNRSINLSKKHLGESYKNYVLYGKAL